MTSVPYSLREQALKVAYNEYLKSFRHYNPSEAVYKGVIGVGVIDDLPDLINFNKYVKSELRCKEDLKKQQEKQLKQEGKQDEQNQEKNIYKMPKRVIKDITRYIPLNLRQKTTLFNKCSLCKYQYPRTFTLNIVVNPPNPILTSYDGYGVYSSSLSSHGDRVRLVCIHCFKKIDKVNTALTKPTSRSLSLKNRNKMRSYQARMDLPVK